MSHIQRALCEFVAAAKEEEEEEELGLGRLCVSAQTQAQAYRNTLVASASTQT